MASGELTLPYDRTKAPPPDVDALARIRARLSRPLPGDRLMGWLLPLAITLAAGLLRFWHITRPGGARLLGSNGLSFDEVYYAHDSLSMLTHGVETTACTTAGVQNAHQFCPEFIAHPPLGKWMMALGEWLFDHGRTVVITSKSGGMVNHTLYPSSVLSYRFSSALFGTLAVLIIARTARRLFRSTLLGCVAGLLMSLDGLEFVESRIGLLDIFLMFWVLVSFAALVIDRDHTRNRLAKKLQAPVERWRMGPWLGFRPWRWVSGIAIGAACGVKWSGAYYIFAWLLLVWWWDSQARREARTGAASGFAREGDIASGSAVKFFFLKWAERLYSLLPLALAPAVVYILCWLGWFLAGPKYAYYWGEAIPAGMQVHGFTEIHDVLKGWWYYQKQIDTFDNNLAAGHPYRSRPWGWLLMTRPILYYYSGVGGASHASQLAAMKACGSTKCSTEVIALGNPAIWWTSIFAFVACGWRWIARKDWRGAAILLPFLAGYLPWLYLDVKPIPGKPGAHRTMFFYYMVPELPFIILAVTLLVGLMLGDHKLRRITQLRRGFGIAGAVGYIGLVLALFVYFFPAWDGQQITYAGYHERIWFFQCSNTNHTQENGPCWF